MGVTGDGNHPLISSWFTPRYNYPYKSLHMLRRSIGVESDTADHLIWTDFFFDAAGGAAAITGTVSLNQATQSLTAIGTETFSGAVATAQARQSFLVSGSIPIPVTGTVSLNQAIQTLLASGTETFSGTVVLGQAAQSLAAQGHEDFSGTVVTGQAAQALAALGDNGEASPVTGDVALNQAAQTLESAGSITEAAVAPPEAIYPRNPITLLPSFEVPVQRVRRQGQVGSAQARQSVSAIGYVQEVIRGASDTGSQKQVTTVKGRRRTTYALDVKTLLELIESEAA